jgi:hypothetical protein
MKKLILFAFTVLLISCEPGERSFIKAIEQYYEESNRAAGGGHFAIDYIELIQIDRDNKRVLAKVVGRYSNASIANGPNNKSEEHILWYFYEEDEVKLRINAIRTPEQLKKQRD